MLGIGGCPESFIFDRMTITSFELDGPRLTFFDAGGGTAAFIKE